MPDQSINLFILTLYGSVFSNEKKKETCATPLKENPLIISSCKLRETQGMSLKF